MLGDARLVAFVASSDLRRSERFYGELLGLRRLESSSIATAFDAGGTTVRVTLVEEPARAAYTVLGWSVPDLGAEMAELGARGVRFERYPGLEQDPAGVWTAPGGSRIAWFEDPDGNTLSLQQPPGA